MPNSKPFTILQLAIIYKLKQLSRIVVALHVGIGTIMVKAL